MEEKKRIEFTTGFNDLYQEFCDTIKSNIDKFNAKDNLKIIGAYCGILFGYCKEIEILLSTKWYTSIIPLTRDLVECFATVKKLETCYPKQSDFEDFYKYLVFLDILQDRTIYEQLRNDKTIIDTNRRDSELTNFLDRFNNLIKLYFSSDAGHIDPNNFEITLFTTIDNIWPRYKNKNKYPPKHKFVGDMLFQNSAWKKDSGGTPYEKSFAIYSTLCHSTHNNISSVEDRIVDNGYFKLNNESSHLEAVLSLAYYCCLDVLEELKTILA